MKVSFPGFPESESMNEEYTVQESEYSIYIQHDGIQGFRGNTLRNITIDFQISCSLSKNHSVYNINKSDKLI